MMTEYEKVDHHFGYNDYLRDGVLVKSVWHSGRIEYYDENGDYHRDDGPAVIDNGQFWYKHGKFHRLDGPAYSSYKEKSYWIDGVEYTEEQFKVITFTLHRQSQNDCA